MTDPGTGGPDDGSGPLAPGPWLFLAFGVALFLLGLVAWSPFPAGVWHDDGVYVLLGRALASGEGLRYTGVVGAPLAPKFPPLYPLTVAGLWGLLGGVGRVTMAASLLNLGFLAVAGALFAHLLHRRLGTSVPWAVGLVALAWLPLTLWRSALVPFSEPLFLLALVVAVGAALRVEERPDDRWALALFVAASLVAIHVRTAGVVVVAAGASALLLAGRARAAGLAAGATGAGLVPWAVWSARAGGGIPEPLRDILGPYGPWLLDQIRRAPGRYLETLHGQALDLVHRSATVLLPAPPSLEPLFDDLRWWALLLFVPALVLGADRLWSRARTPLLFLLGYLALIWIWPFRDDRLLMPAAPFLVLVVAEGFRWSGEGTTTEGAEGPREEASARWIRGWRGLGVAWGALFAGVSLWGMAAGWPGAGYEVRAPRLARAVQAVDDRTPPEAVVGAPELWAGIHLYTGRTVAPSAPFRPVRSDGPAWGSPAEQYRLWTEAGLDYLVLEGGPVHRRAVERIRSECGEEAAPVVSAWEGGRLVRLAWTPGCRRGLGVVDRGG